MTKVRGEAMQLERGQLYQVHHWQKGWIIAEYASHSDAHVVRGYRAGNFAKLRTWNEPATDYWKDVTESGYCSFRIESSKMQTRPCSEEALETVRRLKQEIAELEQARKAKVRELREFCS